MSNLSSYRIINTDNQLSIEYKNLYSIDGQIYYFSLININLPFVNKFTDSYGWAPIVKVFTNEQEIEDYLFLFQIKEEILLSVIGDNLWYGNIGHALFDGLYPLYLALVKFGYINDEFVLLSSDWSNKQTMSYHIITKFSGNQLMEYNDLDKSKVIYFNTLVAGTGITGNRVMNKEYTLYGEKEYGALSMFKKRLLKAYHINIDKPINKKLKAIIIRNKRFNDYELSVIEQIVSIYKNKLDIKFIDWYHDYKSFEEQLRELEDVDIHITGPGTGMMYMPFLKKGAVNINLGYIEHTQTNTSRPNLFIKESTASDHLLPGWMEQSVCAAANYISTLYYDRFTYNNLEVLELVSIINKAIDIIEQNIIVSNNHNIDALVFKEYCKRVNNADDVVRHLTGIAFFIELFVNEHPDAVPSNLINIELLRKIKDEFGYNRNYEIKL